MTFKLVCPKCQCDMHVDTIGVLVVERASFGPYKVWYADLLKCPGCNVEVVSGFGDNPLRQDHWKDDFREWLNQRIASAPRVIYTYEKPQKEYKND